MAAPPGDGHALQEKRLKHLTSGQHSLLQTELQLRQQQLRRRLNDHLGGLSRTEHARDVLQQDGDDAAQHHDARDVDRALTDLESVELHDVEAALQRLLPGGSTYGVCQQCGDDIPFDRLKAEPWASRCMPCQQLVEAKAVARP